MNARPLSPNGIDRISLTIECPRCHAKAGMPCRRTRGDTSALAVRTHVARQGEANAYARYMAGERA